jgi:hypothetical protein
MDGIRALAQGGTGVIGTGHNGVEGRGDNTGVTGIGGQRGVTGQGPIGVNGQGVTYGVRGDGIVDANGVRIEPVAGVQGSGNRGLEGPASTTG